MQLRFLIVLLFLFSLVLWADQGAFEVISKNKDPLKARPGEVIHFFFQVTNNTGQRMKFFSFLELPTGWEVQMTDQSFELINKQSEIRSFSITVPENTFSGLYNITYIIQGTDAAGFGKTISLFFEVISDAQVEMRLEEPSSHVYAGENIYSSFIVINKTSENIFLLLNAVSSKGYLCNIKDVDSSFPFVQLVPNEYKIIEVQVQARQDIIEQTGHTLQLIAHIVKEGEESKDNKPISIESYVDIYPAGSKVILSRHTLPLELGIGNTEKIIDGVWEPGVVCSIITRGSLDADKKHNLDINLNKQFDIPVMESNINVSENILFNPDDNYKAKYWTDNIELYLGDYYYTVSPLIEELYFSRGVKGEITLVPFKFGGYYHQGETDEIKHHLNGFLSYSALKKDDLKSDSYFYKVQLGCFSIIDESIISDMFFSIKPFGKSQFDIEAAFGNKFDADFPFATRIRGELDNKWIFFDGGFLYADPDYPGKETDVISFDTEVGFRFFNEKFQIDSGYEYENNNFTLIENEEKITAMLNNTVHLKLKYDWLELGTFLSLLYEFEIKDNRLPDTYYDETGHIITLDLFHYTSSYYIYLFASLGIFDGEDNSGLSLQHQYFLVGNIRLNNIFTINLNAMFFKTDSLSPDDLESEFSDLFDFSVDCGLTVNFNKYNKLETSIMYSIAPAGLYKTDGLEHETELRIEYRRKIDVPLGTIAK